MIFVSKKHTQTKKISLANLLVQIYIFFPSKNKIGFFVFQQRKVLLEQFFKC